MDLNPILLNDRQKLVAKLPLWLIESLKTWLELMDRTTPQKYKLTSGQSSFRYQEKMVNTQGTSQWVTKDDKHETFGGLRASQRL